MYIAYSRIIEYIFHILDVAPGKEHPAAAEKREEGARWSLHGTTLEDEN